MLIIKLYDSSPVESEEHTDDSGIQRCCVPTFQSHCQDTNPTRSLD